MNVLNGEDKMDSDEIIDILRDMMTIIGNGDDIIKEKDVIIKMEQDHVSITNKKFLDGKELTKRLFRKPIVSRSKIWSLNSIFARRYVGGDRIIIEDEIAYWYDEDTYKKNEITFTLGDEECIKIINYFNIKTGGNYLNLGEIYEICINIDYEEICKYGINENKVIFCKENEKIIKYIYNWDDINDNEKDIYEYMNLIINKDIKLVEGNQIKIYKNNKRYDIGFIKSIHDL